MMSLIKCNECGKEISDKTQSCPNCGCPIEKLDNVENNGTEIKNSDAIKGILIAVVVLTAVLICSIAIMTTPKKEKAINNTADDTSITIEYQTNPITGETTITEINGKSKSDIFESIMEWLGFEKVEE